ncbi:hypothetical protein HLK59_38320 [Streptomyces sp. S3(2020)]|uniref:hypothetical protein n=1 Tax=Streptomyces sp. S3(2020) TaxID=2732044 RepID=UPI0014895A33|nr:hypothetical protein [Streptomyces sp. S3(2020)]NNN36120.1 hypothetical protein [Streptomyces sp. S3(2020)]
MIDTRHWVSRAARVHQDDGYTYESFARELVDQLGWTAAVDLAAAIRGHVYGWPGGHPLHTTVKPLYDLLGWEQAALIASWFRDSRNLADAPPTNTEEPLVAAPKAVFAILLCPACRAQRRCRAVGTATVASQRREVVECGEASCGLQWVATRQDLTTAPAQA